MNFQAMRSDGYSDTDIVESLRQSELFKDTADFDGLRKKGFDDTKIIDFLDATPSFHEVVATRREKAKALQPSTPPQNNEGDVEALGDTAAPQSPSFQAPDAPTMPAQETQGDNSVMNWIKEGGKEILKGLGFLSNVVSGEEHKEAFKESAKMREKQIASMEDGVAKSSVDGINTGLNTLGHMADAAFNPVDYAMGGGDADAYSSPAGINKKQASQIETLFNPAEQSMLGYVGSLIGIEDKRTPITEEQINKRVENVAKILNKPTEDIFIDTNPKSETYGVPYVKGKDGQFLSTKSESVWENMSVAMEADFLTILAQIGADKAGWDAGGKIGDQLAKSIPDKFLAGKFLSGLVKGGSRIIGSAISSTAATPLGTIAQKDKNAYQTGVHEDADAYVSEAWRDMKDNFAATVAGGVALEGVVAGAKGAKNVYTATKDFVTGEDRAYVQMLKDFKVDEQYAKDSLNELNQMLENPLEDSKQARTYAMALKHPQGLEVLRESMRRNTTAYNNVENEILQRSEQLKGLLDDKTLKAGELQSFLDEAEKDASKQYQSMRLALREQTAGAKVVIDQEGIASTIESLLPKVINEEGKKSIENLVSLIRGAEYLTQNVDGLLELRHLVNRRMRKANITEDFAPNDFEIVKGLLDGIDQTVYKTIDDTVSPEDAKTLKNIFETAKIDYSTQKRAEASSFFKKITTEGLSHGDRVNRLAKGLKADDESSDFVLSRLSSEQRERLELTAIHETIMKNLSGEQGGVQAMNHTKALKNLEELSANMKSSSAKETIDMLTKLGSLYAKDRSLLINVADHKTNTLALSPQGRLEFSIMSRVFEFVERRSPFMGDKGRRLQLYHRMGKYMETSRNTKELALKMYNDPLATAQDKAWWGKYIHYYKKDDGEGMAQLMQTIPEPPKGGGSGLMDEDEIANLSKQGKEVTEQEVKKRLDDEAKAFKNDDTTPPDDNGGGGGSPKLKEGVDNGVQGQKEALKRQSVEEIEASTGKTLDQLGDEDGFYTHYSAHEFDTLSSNGDKDAGNLGQTKGKETNENHTINVTFGYKQGARVENEHGIGLAGQHEYKIDLRGKTFFDDDKHNYFFNKVEELKNTSPELSTEALHVKAKEALGYDDATVDTIVDFQKRYDAMRKSNPNQTTKDTQNSVLKEMKLDGIGNKNHLEIFEDAPVYKVRTLEHDMDYAGMTRPRSVDGLPPVSGEGMRYADNLYGTVESTPSKTDPFVKVLDTLSPQERIDFEKEHIPLVQQLAEDLGLKIDVEVSHGAFEGQTNPNMIIHFKEFYAKSRFADTKFKFKDEYGNLSVQAREQIDAFLTAFGKATNQDAVGWYAPIFRGDQTGKHGYVEITEPLTIDQWKTLYAKLQGEWGEIVPVMHKGRIDFMNWPELEGKQFETIVMDAIDSLESGVISKKIVKFNNDGTLIERTEYERWMGSSGSESGRHDIPTGDSRIWDNATQRFEQGIQDLRRGLQERPKLDGGQKTVQDSIGATGGTSGEVQTLSVTQQQAGEQLASDLKDAPPSTFKGGYVRPEVLSFMTKTLTGATGGSLTEYDYNQDGKIDFKDRAIGAALGVVGFHALTSQPAFSAYKALAEHGIKQLETRAEQGDIIAQMALGTRYIYASGKAGEKGAFSDIATKAVMKEIDDSGAKISFTYDAIPSTDRHIVKQFERYKNGELSQSDFEFYVSQRMNKELDTLFNKRKNGEIDSFDYYKQRQSIEDKYFDIKVGDKTSGKLEDFLQHDALYEEYPFLKDIDVSVKRISSSGYFDPVKKEIVIDSASKDKDTTLLHEIQHAIQTKEGWAKGSSVGNGDYEFLVDDVLKIGAEMKHLEEIASNARKNGIDPFTNKEFAERYFSTDAKLQRTREEAKLARHEGRTGFNDYQRHWGEQQSRAVEYRKNMTPEQRAKESWQETLKREEGKYDEPIIKYENGEMLSAVLTDRYMVHDMVNKEALLKDALPFKDVAYTKENFAAQFGVSFGDTVTVKTPKGVPDITIDTLSQFHKLNPKNYKDDRRILVGIINDLLTDPLFVVEHNGARKFFGVFDDKKDGIYAISVSEKKGQLNVLSSNYRPLKNRKVDWKTIKNLMKVPDGDVLYVRGGEKL